MAYQIYDSGRQFIKDKLGDEGMKNFDKLSGAINTMLNLALIAAMATMKVVVNVDEEQIQTKIKIRSERSQAKSKRFSLKNLGQRMQKGGLILLKGLVQKGSEVVDTVGRSWAKCCSK